MLRRARSWAPRPEIDARALLLLTSIVSMLLLLVSIYYLNAFREQRLSARANEARLSEWRTQLLTATPAAMERERLAIQLDLVREEFAAASGLLPGTDVETQIQQRVLEAATLSGVSMTALNKVGDSFQEGALVGWRYELSANGDLPRLTEFVSRLEEEAFPAAHLSAPLLNQAPDGSYNLSSDLTVYGSTLSTAELVADAGPLLPDELAVRLRDQAATARAEGDYELALSSLLQLAALRPDDPTIDADLYGTYVDYAEALLRSGYPDLAEEQADAALVLNPSGQEAVAILVQIAQGSEGTPSATEPAIAFGTPTATATERTGLPPTVPVPGNGQSTRTPRATSTRSIPPTVPAPATNYPTRTPFATSTPRPGVTLIPLTATPRGSATSPATSATPVTTRTATSVPNPYPYGSTGTFYQPNCGLTQIKGYIRTQSGTPINGVVVRVWYDGAPSNQIYSFPSGSGYTNQGPGYWDVVLDNKPKAGTWYIHVVDPQTGQALSDTVTAETDTGPCLPHQSGKQVVIQDFIRWSGSSGTPVPTSTTGPSPTATRTTTATPTPSPTATLPPTLYTVDEDPDLEIPDGPNGTVESLLLIGDSTILRDARVFLNIFHEDVADLRIDLIHPDGAFVRLHDFGDGAGQTSIRRWININNPALQALADKSIEGQWTLRITDGVEGLTGTLLSWQLEVYP